MASSDPLEPSKSNESDEESSKSGAGTFSSGSEGDSCFSDSDEEIDTEKIETRDPKKEKPLERQKIPEKSSKRKVVFKEDVLERDSLTLPSEDPDKKKKEEREEKLTTYLSALKVEDKPESVEEALQRMQYEEKIKQLMAHLELVKFTITPSELSHLFKTYPSILIPEIAATFLSGSNIAAVNNMIAHGFVVDRRTEDFYSKMKDDILYGLSEKERKRIEIYYESTDKWLKDRIDS
jgi:hypothetical protein